MTILITFGIVILAILACVGVVIFSKKPAPPPKRRPDDNDETIFMTHW